MTLENMRSIGVRSVEAGCECGRHVIVEIESLPGAIEVPSLAPSQCSACGAHPNDVRPNWREYRAPGMDRSWP
jgi:hypothetical protein